MPNGFVPSLSLTVRISSSVSRVESLDPSVPSVKASVKKFLYYSNTMDTVETVLAFPVL